MSTTVTFLLLSLVLALTSVGISLYYLRDKKQQKVVLTPIAIMAVLGAVKSLFF